MIGITAAAFEAIAALPFGSVVFERDPDAKGEHQIGLSRMSSTGSRLCAGRARAM